MISRHAKTAAVAVRTDPHIRDAAKDALAEREWEVAEFIVACLRAVAADPDRLLRLLARHRVRPVKGRPRRQPEE